MVKGGGGDKVDKGLNEMRVNEGLNLYVEELEDKYEFSKN